MLRQRHDCAGVNSASQVQALCAVGLSGSRWNIQVSAGILIILVLMLITSFAGACVGVLRLRVATSSFAARSVRAVVIARGVTVQSVRAEVGGRCLEAYQCQGYGKAKPGRCAAWIV